MGGRLRLAWRREAFPARWRALEVLAVHHLEYAVERPPAKALDLDAICLDVYRVKGIELTPRPRRRRGPCLNHDGVVTAVDGLHCHAASVADVQMPGQQEIAAAGRKHVHRQLSPPDALVRHASVRKIERMVRHNDLDDFRVERAQAHFRVVDLG